MGSGPQRSGELSATREAPAHPRLRRWGPLGLAPAMILVAVNFLDGMEGNFIPGILPLLQDEWGFGDTAAGAIPTAMAMAGLVVTLPAGYLADRAKRTRLLALVVASWSVFTMASGLVTAFWMFFLVRVLLGTAAHVDNPVTSSLITDFYPPESRARVFALQRAAWYMGISLGVAVGGVLGDAFGWRAPFFVMFAPGLVVAFFVWRLSEPVRGGLDGIEADRDAEHEPDADSGEVRASSPQELDAPAYPALAADAVPSAADPEAQVIARARRGELGDDLRALLAVPSLRLIFVGVAVAFGGFNGLGYWLPTFWQREFELGEGQSAVLTGVVALSATLAGSWIGGVLGDRWHERRPTGRIDLAGRTLAVGGGLLAIALIMPSLALQIPVLIVAAVLIVSGMPSYAAAVADVLPASRRGIGFALFTFLVTLSTALGPLGVGIVSDLTGSLRGALVAAALPCVPGALVLLRARRTIVDDMDAARAASRPAASSRP